MKSRGKLAHVIDVISQIFMPIVGLLAAAGILRGIITIFVTASLLSVYSQTFLVLDAMASSVFYFMPILLAFTAAKKFNANPYTAVVIAGVLLIPSLHTVLETGYTIRFFGLPILGVQYSGSIIPMILSVWLLSYVEGFFNKIFPEMVRGFLTPLASVFIVGAITLFAFGPAGVIIGEIIAVGYGFIFNISPIIAGLIIGAAIQPMVIFGVHWAILLLGMNNAAINGYDTVIPLIAAAVFAQAGAVFALMIKSTDKTFKATCASAILSALFGVTEPAVFGINLPRKKPMIAACIGGGIGGGIAGFAGVQINTFVLPSVATLPAFLGEGFMLFLISCVVGFLIAFGITFIIKCSTPLQTP